MNFLASVGRATLTFLADTGRLARFTAQAVLSCFAPPIYGRMIGQQFLRIGYFSLPVVGLTAFFTGGSSGFPAMRPSSHQIVHSPVFGS